MEDLPEASDHISPDFVTWCDLFIKGLRYATLCDSFTICGASLVA